MSQQLAVMCSIAALLGSAVLLLLLLLASLWGLMRHQPRLARLAGAGAGGVIGVYLLVLVATGVLSRDRLLPPGAEKIFCEIDCHLGYAITGVMPGAAPGNDARQWTVMVRTRFDEATISPRRGREAPLWPSPRRVRLRDSAGGVHEPLPDAPAAADSGTSTPLTTPLRPGESYVTALRFALPAGVAPVALVIEDAEAISAALIGHERSPWHGKTMLALPAPPS
jgi:hypothetical protein